MVILSLAGKSFKCPLCRYNVYVVVQRIRELEAETAALRMELSPLYSQIILKFSSYEKPQQDRCASREP